VQTRFRGASNAAAMVRQSKKGVLLAGHSIIHSGPEPLVSFTLARYKTGR
jgi:hypothetical protein